MSGGLKPSYDVVVIGGGPAGTSTACIVAEAGCRTLLVEREAVPRFHVGESLMPETYWPLQRLGLQERIESECFLPKVSVRFVTNSGKESAPFYFRQHDPRPCSRTWQVERAQFDKMIWDRAEELGADCVDQCRVKEVHFDDQQRATGLTLQTADGQTHRVECQVVVDGSGQSSVIANRLGLKKFDENLRKAAIWGYWRGAIRGEGDDEGATIVMHTEHKESWFWFIPLSGEITSIGCVGDNDYLLRRGKKPSEVYAEEIAICPGLQERLTEATQVGEVLVAKEFTYTTRQHAGPGWVLVGDAFGFIDPIYSSGVYFALEMGVRAGDAIIAGLKAGDLSGEQLGAWTEDFKAGSNWVRKLVDAFYSKDFSIGRFLKEHPEHQSNLTDLLIGRIFHEDAGNIFKDMDPILGQQAG